MDLDKQLPGPIARFLKSGFTAEYATISAAGMPVDTPVLYFPSPGLASIDLATGLSYPAKAERARRNPKVGLLIEGGPDEPVISIAGMAAVRDADLQANVLRYLSEASQALPHNPSWELAQKAVWYWTRMLVAVAPVRIDWWDNPAALDGPPQSWQAPHGTLFPPSDPAPPGQTSTPAAWRHPPWRELAAEAQARGDKPYLSVIDADGFPRPIGVNSANVTSNGFQLELPRGVPWTIAGNACLTFRGIETFLGEIEGDMLRVERTLPVFPMTTDMTQLWEPTPDTRTQLMARLEHELERRGSRFRRYPRSVRHRPNTTSCAWRDCRESPLRRGRNTTRRPANRPSCRSAPPSPAAARSSSPPESRDSRCGRMPGHWCARDRPRPAP